MAEEYENWFQVDRHANGGFIVLQMIDDQGNPFNLATIDIPESAIPLGLRAIGSRFRMRWGSIDTDTVDKIRDKQKTVYRVTEWWTDSR